MTRNIILLFFGLFGLLILMLYLGSLRSKEELVSVDNTANTGQSQSVGTVEPMVYEQQIKNALITVPDTDVKISLVDGRASYGTVQEGGDVTLLKVFGGEKVPTGKKHIFSDIVVQSGGTGTFHYVGLFDVTGEKAVYSSSYFIGDRVILLSASTTPKDARSYLLTVHYLDRNEGEAMIEEPTVPKQVTIEVRDGLFVQKSL